MQKVIFSFVFMFLAAFTLQAQDGTPAVPADPNAPEITFNELIHDYGTVTQGSEATCEFKFTNIGKEPLILQKPVSSCGCTVPTWPQEPVLPGKSDVIKVTYSTHNVGPINKTITVNSNAKTAHVVLSIKGNVIAKPAEKIPEKTNEGSATPIQK